MEAPEETEESEEPRCPSCRRPPLDVPLPEPSTILILGILGFMSCGLLGIFAWIKGNEYMNKCRALKFRPSGIAVAGRSLGIVCCAIMAVKVIGAVALVLTFTVR
jgi:hypothetical protein